MSNTYLKPLTSLGTPNLVEFDRDAMANEIVDMIQSDPNWNSQWDGELLQNAAWMIINTFSFLYTKNAEAANRLIREVFITEARDPRSIANILSSYGVNYKQNTAAIVPLSVLNSTGGLFTSAFTIPAGFSVNGQDIDGNDVNFEIYRTDSVDPSKIDYTSSITINSGYKTVVNAYSGTTVVKTVEIPASQREKFVYKLNSTDVIEGSTRIFYEIGGALERELIRTDSFVVEPVNPDVDFPGGTPHFKEKFYDNGDCDIIFGTESLGGSFPNSSSTITIYYRIGGGALTNIPTRGINTVLPIPISNTKNISALFRNDLAGGGGSDREDILEAQFYAPYRIGRSGAIVDDIDAINELSSTVLKHTVDSPKYSDKIGGDTVPILHYWNRIVPLRDFNNFSFPLPNQSDTAETYKASFEEELNKFLNLIGIHDGFEEDILTSLFTTTDFTTQLTLTPALNGTLAIKAFDKNNLQIDELRWTSNYSGILNSPDILTNVAKITSSNPVDVVSVATGINDVIRFKIDEYVPGGQVPVTEYFDIVLAQGIYGLTDGLPQAICAEINNKIKQASTYYSAFSGTFCYPETTGEVTIASQTTGQRSQVKLFPVDNSVYSAISIEEGFTDAAPQNGRVFSAFANYNHTNATITTALNASRFDVTKNPEQDITWPNAAVITGPSYSFTLLDESGETIELQIGEDLNIELYSGSNSLLDTLTFTSISSVITNTGTANLGTCFDDTLLSSNTYEYSTGTISVKLTDSNRPSAPHNFPETVANNNIYLYDQNSYFLIKYKHKTWKFTTVTYEPNPYTAEGEALSFLNKLRARGKKSLAIEPMLKKINYIPLLVQVNVIPERGISKEQVIQNTEELIYNSFGFDNRNSDIQIGQTLPISTIQSTLANKDRNRGVASVSVLSPVAADATNGDEYFFVLPEEFIERIELFEENYPSVAGFSLLYRPRVNAI